MKVIDIPRRGCDNYHMKKLCPLCGAEVCGEVADKLGTPLAELELSDRVLNALARHEIFTVEQVARYSQRDLLRLRYIGVRKYIDLAMALKEVGVKLQ